MVQELLGSELRVRGVLVAPQLDGAQHGAELRARIAASGIEMAVVTESEFRSAAETESPQGVLAVAEVPDHGFARLAGAESLRILVLDGLQDPGNVGTLLRTAAALGADATIALPGTVDIWNAKVVRSAMGANFHHVAFHCSLEELDNYLKSSSVDLWAAEGAGTPIGTLSAPQRLALAVGNEGAGLSSPMRGRAQQLVSLPIAVRVESLNVAVAAGILLHQLRR